MERDCSTQPGFWRRQFGPRATRKQVAFDVAFGLVLPVVCLYFDPIVLRSSANFGGPLLADARAVALGTIWLGLLSLTAWLIGRRPAALLAGLLAGGAFFALLLGLYLLPLSFIGLFFGIGVLGFTPFLTAFAFWRNAVRAVRASRRGRPLLYGLITLGLAVSCLGPWAAQGYVDRETARGLALLESDDPDEAARGVQTLWRIRFVFNADGLVTRFDCYDQQDDKIRKARFAKVYRELTGGYIEDRLMAFRD